MAEQLTSNIPIALTLGFFDSVHLGHRALIQATRDYAYAHNIKSAVLTYINNPYKHFNKDSKLIYTYNERVQLLDALTDYVLPMRFDREFKDTEALSFLNNLTRAYNIKCFVCGYDFLFGKGGQGDINVLRTFCNARGIDLIVKDKIEHNNQRVSTSLIKELLGKGQIERANELLTCPYFACGTVVKGRGAGRMFDMPTANLKFNRDKLIIGHGVYGTVVKIDGAYYKSATNIGPRPTFDLSLSAVECFIKDFNQNIYDHKLTLYFYKFLRCCKRFTSPAELAAQVKKDIEWESGGICSE